MAVAILASCSPGEIRAAAVRDGVLVDYAVHRPGAPDRVGDRMRGRVVAHVPAMAGAFVALPGGEEGFLPDSQGGAGLSNGDPVTVLVVRAALGGKGPRLSANTPQAGAGQPALLARGPDAVARLLALHPGAELVVDDPAAASPAARVVPRAWDDDVAEQVDALASPLLALPGGVTGRVEPTAAVVAIDLDLAPGRSASKAAAQREANRAALPGVARAIRLRNLSGGIVLDLAGMTVKARGSLGADVARALEGDPLGPRFLGFSALGLAEILRPRVHPPLHELMSGPHAAGLAALRALARADPASVLRLRAAPDVARALDEDAAARADLARRTGRGLMAQSDPSLAPSCWRLDPVERRDAVP